MVGYPPCRPAVGRHVRGCVCGDVAMIGNEYRTALQAQNARYEDSTGLPVGDTDRQEYRDYFGIGDHVVGLVREVRVTPKQWLVSGAGEQSPDLTPDQARPLTGLQLALLAHAGDLGAADEIVRRAINAALRKVAA